MMNFCLGCRMSVQLRRGTEEARKRDSDPTIWTGLDCFHWTKEPRINRVIVSCFVPLFGRHSFHRLTSTRDQRWKNNQNNISVKLFDPPRDTRMRYRGRCLTSHNPYPLSTICLRYDAMTPTTSYRSRTILERFYVTRNDNATGSWGLFNDLTSP